MLWSLVSKKGRGKHPRSTHDAMNALFWNIRGITTPEKKHCIIETLAKHKPSIIAFQETKKENLSASFLKSISGDKPYNWHHLPAEGTSGCVLVGVDLDISDVINWKTVKYSVACDLVHKTSEKAFRFIAVYGSPYDDGKHDFISELHSMFIDDHQPTIIGGDFNLVRYQKDKNNGRINQSWSDKFNAWVEIWNLLEIKMSGRQFTWANNQDNLIMSTIDRIFCTTELDSLFPLSSSQALRRTGSDHTPMLWDSGIDSVPKSSSYKFEKWWLLRAEFKELVEKNWSAPVKSTTSIDIWQEKVRRFRKFSRGWSRNIDAEIRKTK